LISVLPSSPVPISGLSTVTLTTSPMRLQVQQFLQIKQQYIHAFFKLMCLALRADYFDRFQIKTQN
jgi:hypothetical protein